MIFDILLLILAFYLSIPAVVGYTAKSYGNSFWLWFSIGFFLPIVSHILLIFHIKKESKKANLTSLLTAEEIFYMEEEIKSLPETSCLKSKKFIDSSQPKIIV